MRYILPKLDDDGAFEELCCEIMNMWYPNGYHIYGRKGQIQHGIDIIPNSTCLPFIQCKNYHDNDKKTVSKFKKEITKDYNSAKNYFNCSEFFVFTALNRDVSISDHVLYLKDTKNITIVFWETITAQILAHSQLLKTYYPFYFNHDDYEIMQRQEDDYVKQIIDLINRNNNTLNNMSLYSKKSSDLYAGEDFYYEYIKIENDYSPASCTRVNHIRHFFMLIEELLHIMAMNSTPYSYNPEIRVPNKNIPLTTIDDFTDKWEMASDLLKKLNAFNAIATLISYSLT